MALNPPHIESVAAVLPVEVRNDCSNDDSYTLNARCFTSLFTRVGVARASRLRLKYRSGPLGGSPSAQDVQRRCTTNSEATAP